MKVKAFFNNNSLFGFYGGHVIRDGDTFDLTSTDHFSSKWMTEIKEASREPAKPKKPSKKKVTKKG